MATLRRVAPTLPLRSTLCALRSMLRAPRFMSFALRSAFYTCARVTIYGVSLTLADLIFTICVARYAWRTLDA